MKKRFFLIFAAMLLCVSNIMAQVASGVCGDNITWELTAEGELVIEGTGEMTDYASTDNASYENLSPWYETRENISRVKIGEGITSIGFAAFFDCRNLASATIPASVTTIKTSAFRDSGIRDITFAENSQLKTLDIGAFNNCTSLSSICLPASVTSIGNGAFFNYRGLCITCMANTPPTVEGEYTFYNVDKSIPIYVPTSSVDAYKAAYGWSQFTNIQQIIIASGTCGDNLTWKLTDEGELVIEGTGAMTDYEAHSAPWFAYKDDILSVTIKPGVTTVGKYAIGDCGNLTTVTIPESVTSIGLQAFQYCYKLTSVTLSEGLKSINWGAFAECHKLPSIVIPESVTTIENYAFTHCYALTSINIPESVTSIGIYAFRLTGINDIVIPAGVSSLPEGAFESCTALASITCKASTPPSLGNGVFRGVSSNIPVYVPAESVEAYKAANGWSAFTNILPSGTCGENLTWKLTDEGELVIEGTGEMTSAPWGEYKQSINTITVCEGVTSIYWEAFRGCKCTAVSLPNTLTSIGYQAFNGCPLTSIVLPQSVKSVDRRVFCDCGSLSSVTLNEGLESLGGETFRACASLTSIEIPASMKTIAGTAFYECTNLASVIINEGVQVIGSGAFSYCYNMASLTLPASITAIGNHAFRQCVKLSYIISNPTTPPTIDNGSDAFYEVDKSVPLYVPVESVEAYKAANGWSEFTNIQPMIIASGTCGESLTWRYHEGGKLVVEGTGEMYNYANNSFAPWYNYRGSINSLEIKDGVTGIGSWAFAGCSTLTDVAISESVKTIGNNAFRGCSILEEITLPTGLTQLGAEVFYECRNLKTATLPEGLSSIETSTFYHCGNLQSVVIPESVTSLGWGVFFGCGKLTSVTCNATTPPSCSDTSFFAFNIAACTLYVPDESESAYQQANYWKDFTKPLASGTCGDNLTWRLTYGDELVIEGTGAMFDYENGTAPWYKYKDEIKTLTIKEGVSTVGNWAFTSLKNMFSISIPGTVSSLGTETFKDCNSLVSITLPVGLKTVGWSSFYGCAQLSTVEFPEGLETIGNYAFADCSKISSLIFPESLTQIGMYAFRNCGPSYIICKSATPPTMLSGYNGDPFSNKSMPLYVPVNSIADYKVANLWKEFTNIQPMIIASGTCGDNLIWKYHDGNELVIEGTGDMYNYSNNSAAPWNSYRGSIKNINIKDGVTSIGSWAFADCAVLTDVSIPESVTTIGGDAFRECSILEEITLPTGLIQLGTGVFLYCDALRTITVPEGVTKIGSDTFEFCPNLSSITFPSGLTEIGPWALKGAYNLASITCKATTPPSLGSEVFSGVNNSIPVYVPASSVEAYKAANGWSAFTNIQPITIASGTCGEGLTWQIIDSGELIIEGTGEMTSAPWSGYKESIKKITIKEGVTSIYDGAFRDCNKVITTTIPEGVTRFGWDVFYGCTGELYLNSLPNDDMMYDLFYGSKLTRIVVGEGISVIGRYIFADLYNVTEIVLPESLTTIEDMAFMYCQNLTTITIPANVTSIGTYAFDGCTGLTSIICKGTVPPVCGGNLFYNNKPEMTLFVPITATSNYKSATQWKDFDYIVGTAECGESLTCELWPDGKLFITGEGNITSAPWGTCGEQVKELVIEDGVTGIADEAFSSLGNLLSITSHAEVPPVCNANAFAGVDKGTPVYVPVDKLELYAAAEGWSEFINLTSSDSRILLDNFAEYSNAADENFEEITYKRTFNNTEWQALYVPFEIPVTEEFLAEFEVADLNDIRQYDRDDDGIADETVVEAFKVTDGVLEANYPYLIRAKETGEKNIIVTDATLYATEENSVDCSSVHERYTFTSTYSTIAASALTGCYALSNGVWQPVADDTSLGAFRFYLSIESRDGNMQAAQKIRMHIIGRDNGDDAATSIDNFTESGSLGSEVVYDLQGRPTTKPGKGMYIINGKKVFIK